MAYTYTMEYFTGKKELTVAHNKRHITERNKLDTKEHAREILFIRRPTTGIISVKEARMIVTLGLWVNEDSREPLRLLEMF